MASFEKILKLDVAHEQSYIYLKCKQYDHNSRRSEERRVGKECL